MSTGDMSHVAPLVHFQNDTQAWHKPSDKDEHALAKSYGPVESIGEAALCGHCKRVRRGHLCVKDTKRV